MRNSIYLLIIINYEIIIINYVINTAQFIIIEYAKIYIR